MSADTPRLAMVAGEASGDLLAAELLGGLRARWPALQPQGIGGPRMIDAGFRSWWPQHLLAVHGYADAIRHYPQLWNLRRELGARLIAEPPQAFIGIDAPDFNLGLEARLKGAGIRTVHFVCPSIWAWRGGRVKRIRRSADHVLCLFPFEPELLHREGIGASYVGHPLADVVPLEVPRATARAGLGIADDAVLVAVLPGSRVGEIRHIAPAFLAAAALLQQRRPGLRFVLPAAPRLRPLIEPLIAQHAPGVALQLIDGRSHEALAACDAALVASGTATLEAALFKRPMVIGYRMHGASWQLMKRMKYQPWAGLPNILSREFVVPEFIQEACEPAALADATLAQLDDTAAAARLAERFLDIHLLLRRDTARRATDAIAQILEH